MGGDDFGSEGQSVRYQTPRSHMARGGPNSLMTAQVCRLACRTWTLYLPPCSPSPGASRSEWGRGVLWSGGSSFIRARSSRDVGPSTKELRSHAALQQVLQGMHAASCTASVSCIQRVSLVPNSLTCCSLLEAACWLDIRLDITATGGQARKTCNIIKSPLRASRLRL